MTSAELLRKAATALDAGEDPFGEHFLAGHGVTSDQCMVLAQQLAIGARLVARGIETPRSLEGQAMLMSMVRDLE